VTTGRPLLVGAGFGARFDGTDDVLSGLALDRPDEVLTRARSHYGNPTLTSNIDYSGITARGMQMWVRPDSAGLAAANRQTLVMDSVASGGVAITADGKWTQINDGHADADIEATVAVTGDTWYHVMHHVYESSDANATIATGGNADHVSVLYVDGIAVSANADSINTGDFGDAGRLGVLTVGAAELPDTDEDPATAEFGEYFDGTVDDLEMYVFQSPLGGPFDLFTDNEWIANEISNLPGGVLLPGDVDRDGTVEIVDDVNAFVAGWLSENRLVGAHNEILVGDWNTWGQGDMNHDGRTDLRDWRIINAANPALGAAIDSALSVVPEPSSVILLGISLLAIGTRRSRLR